MMERRKAIKVFRLGRVVELAIEAKTRRCLYRYSAGEIDFEFDLLSMVGEPWQPFFKRLIERTGLKIELFEDELHFYERVPEGHLLIEKGA